MGGAAPEPETPAPETPELALHESEVEPMPAFARAAANASAPPVGRTCGVVSVEAGLRVSTITGSPVATTARASGMAGVEWPVSAGAGEPVDGVGTSGVWFLSVMVAIVFCHDPGRSFKAKQLLQTARRWWAGKFLPLVCWRGKPNRSGPPTRRPAGSASRPPDIVPTTSTGHARPSWHRPP